MNSQLNNSNENQDSVFQETDTFRPVFFDSGAKRNSSASSKDSSKRARLDASVIAPKDRQDHEVVTADVDDDDVMDRNPSSPSANASPGKPANPAPALINQHRQIHHRHLLLQHHLISQPSSPTPDSSSASASTGVGVGVGVDVDVDVDVDMDEPAGNGPGHDRSRQTPSSSKTTGASKTNGTSSAAAAAAVAHMSTPQPHKSSVAPKLPSSSTKTSQVSTRSNTHKNSISKKSTRALPVATGSSSTTSKAPKFVRRFRSRSLPIINYTSRSQLFQHHMFQQRVPHQQLMLLNATNSQAPNFSASSSTNPSSAQSSSFFSQPSQSSSSSSSASHYHHHHHHHHHHTPATPSLPPINLQSLKEIDLHEILKNPQLRHDILFDPQLQFRPNLDGERGRRKKTIIENYWSEIEAECRQFFDGPVKPNTVKLPRLPVLFTTLRDILLSLLPVKDRAPVNEIMDIDLLVQQLSHGSFDFVAMAKWLGEVFKSHCAPMRDQWVSDMISKFQQSYEENSVEKLVQGLRTIFFILEAMKLDVANHQIRILRPVLIETANEFEKDYFDQLITHCKIDITDSLKWYYRNYHKKADLGKVLNKENMSDADTNKAIMVSAIIDLLSCRNMATEFPSTLAFDHTRLVLLRADVRQQVCVQLCVVLFKQLLHNYKPAASYRSISLKPEYITKVQEEVLAIVTDDNGSVKWTRNVQAIALQLVKNVVTDSSTGTKVTNNLPQSMVDFGYNWLIKQIQPNSDVYGLMEGRIFKELLTEIVVNLNFDTSITATTLSNDLKSSSSGKIKKSDSEMGSIASRISTLVKFHWSVFGDYYTNYVKKGKISS
ncbi:Protein SOSEKI 1 [Candidozyma auris]|uniref:Uncharacterized protein n=2 Tax=Candidozyma auris TaxID=498019 RepID=A0A2H1A6F9_CANAR|nr:hypothetical protein B9J08_000662 [[Candida] auris]QWW23443.1 hypothetical protein CA7LBN_002244 [[Candida] auris]